MTTPFDPPQKLLRHPAHMAAFQAGDWRYPPIGVEVSPTNSCNARCPWCFYVSSSYKQHHSHEELPWHMTEDLLAQLGRAGVKSVTWTGGGEPSTYSRIDDAIHAALCAGLKQGMFTNGYVRIKQPEALEWIRITVTERFLLTKHVREYAEATEVGVNFNVTNDNQDHLRRMFDEAEEAGVAYFQVRPALADRVELQERVEFPDWLLKRAADSPVRVETTWYKWTDYLKPHGYDVCHGHRLVPFVWHDGKVSVCAYHKQNPDYDFGDLSCMTWEEVWAGERRRRMIQAGVAVIKLCQHCCKLHEVNKALIARPRHEEFV